MLGIRHNMITLLYAAKGHLENHFHRAEAANFRNQDDQLASAEQSLKKSYELVKRTLDITRHLGLRLKSAPQIHQGARANLRDIWAAINRELPSENLNSSVQINTSLPRNFPELLCDQNDLQEALSLLVQNSLDAFNALSTSHTTVAWPDKRVILRAEIGMSNNETRAIITLADNGPGVSQELISLMFQPFFSTRLEQGGNGLGLYLASQLISKNNGTIRVSSFEGCGCTFVIELPLAAAIPQSSVRVA